MPHLPRTVTSPKKFIIGSGILKELHEYIKDFGDNVLLLCDEFIIERVNQETLPYLHMAGLKAKAEQFNRECTDTEIKRIVNIMDEASANIIVGIGGGKTLDTAKAVAYNKKIPVVILPTIASTDAPCTALTVIYKDSGAFDRYLYLPQNPDVVIVDTSIIAQAPVRFFAAGVGDALATYFEARACYAVDGVNLVLKRPSRTGMGLAHLCYQVLQENVECAMDAMHNRIVTPALEHMIEATIYLSGVGAESGGLAAAHAVNNGMSVVPDLHKAQHGEKVAFGLLTQLVLENAPKHEFDEVIRIMKVVGLPLTLQDMGLVNFVEAEWRKVAEIACDKHDTMVNMPKKVTSEELYQAIIAANSLAERYK